MGLTVAEGATVADGAWEGSRDGVGGVIGTFVVRLGDGTLETEGTPEGEGVCLGLSVGEYVGVGLWEGSGERMGLAVGLNVGACVDDGAGVVGLEEGEYVELWARN